MAVGRQALKDAREAKGFSQGDLAQLLGVGLRTVQRLEEGDSKGRPWLRPKLAAILDVPPEQLKAWLNDEQPQAPNGHVVPPWLDHLASLEQGAAEIQVFEPVVIHAMLQTEDYATIVERVGTFNDEEVAEKVAVRLEQQGVLRREPDPLQLTVILDQSTLLRVPGSNRIMADQLDHLVEISDAPNVSMQVMPLTADVFPAAFGAFKLLTGPESPTPFMAYVEDAAGPHYLDRLRSSEMIDRHVKLFDHLADHALDEAASIDLIRRTCKELYR